MAKAVFRPNEITPVTDKIMLKLSHTFEEEEEKEVEEVEPEYTGLVPCANQVLVQNTAEILYTY